MTRRAAGGFSLLEVLSALALLSLLLLGVFYGIQTATRSVNSGSAAIERNDEARSLQQFLRRDLLQARLWPWKRDAKGKPVVFEGDARSMRFVAPLPGYLDRNGPQLQSLALVDEGKGRLRLELGSAPLSAEGAGVSVDAEVLVANVSEGRFRYYGREQDGAAASWRDRWDVVGRMPELVAIELDRGKPGRDEATAWLWLQAPIRQSANATQVDALARALRAGGAP